MRLYKMMVVSLLAFGFSLLSGVERSQEPLQQMWKYGAALNIEGGSIPQQHLKQNQIWANLCFILDRPFYDGIELKDITKGNVYPLKEGNIIAYNERKAALATAVVLKYYIRSAHKLAALPECEQAVVVVQVHRNSTGSAHVQLLETLIQLLEENVEPICQSGFEPRRLAFPRHKVLFELRYGVAPTSYESAHVVLSISLAAGLHPTWESGSILLPQRFVPFDLEGMALGQDKSYEVRNHLIDVSEQVVALQDEQLLGAINRHFASPNPAKGGEYAPLLSKDDFYVTTLLQVNKLFNPTQLPQEVSVYK